MYSSHYTIFSLHALVTNWEKKNYRKKIRFFVYKYVHIVGLDLVLLETEGYFSDYSIYLMIL